MLKHPAKPGETLEEWRENDQERRDLRANNQELTDEVVRLRTLNSEIWAQNAKTLQDKDNETIYASNAQNKTERLNVKLGEATQLLRDANQQLGIHQQAEISAKIVQKKLAQERDEFKTRFQERTTEYTEMCDQFQMVQAANTAMAADWQPPPVQLQDLQNSSEAQALIQKLQKRLTVAERQGAYMRTQGAVLPQEESEDLQQTKVLLAQLITHATGSLPNSDDLNGNVTELMSLYQELIAFLNLESAVADDSQSSIPTARASQQNTRPLAQDSQFITNPLSVPNVPPAFKQAYEEQAKRNAQAGHMPARDVRTVFNPQDTAYKANNYLADRVLLKFLRRRQIHK